MLQACLSSGMMAPRTPMRPIFATKFQPATKDDLFTSCYLNHILLPGALIPADYANLFMTDVDRLVGEAAIIGLASNEGEPAAGMFMTIDDSGIVWIRGVRVVELYRGVGLGSGLAQEACAFARNDLRCARAALTVRCDAQGCPREAPLRAYRRCGFEFVKILEVPINGSPWDSHLGPTGSTFLTALMEKTL